MSDRHWGNAREVLCVRLDAMGDVLMTTPALRALKQSCPGRRLTLLTSKSGAAIAETIPEVDETVLYEAPWMKATASPSEPEGEYRMARILRAGEFDAAVIFTVYTQSPLPSAFLCHLAGIPLRLAHCRENPYQMLSDWIPEPEPHLALRHECRRQLDLVAAVGCRTDDERMSLRVSERAVQAVSVMLNQCGVDSAGDWAVVHVGATAASRRYPAEQFAEACRVLRQRYGWQLVFTGSREEADLVHAVMPDRGCVFLAGLLRLDELTALLSVAPVLISNNTGPVHIAAALGTPVIDLYALTNPQHTPWMTPHRVLSHDVPCKYCYKSVCPEGHGNCLRLVGPEEVVQAALDLRAECAGRRESLQQVQV